VSIKTLQRKRERRPLESKKEKVKGGERRDFPNRSFGGGWCERMKEQQSSLVWNAAHKDDRTLSGQSKWFSGQRGKGDEAADKSLDE